MVVEGLRGKSLEVCFVKEIREAGDVKRVIVLDPRQFLPKQTNK